MLAEMKEDWPVGEENTWILILILPQNHPETAGPASSLSRGPLNSQALLCCCSTCSLVSIESLDIFPPHFFLISNQVMELRFETKPFANMRPRFSCLWPRFRYLTSKRAPNLTTVQPCTQTVSPVIYECLHK